MSHATASSGSSNRGVRNFVLMGVCGCGKSTMGELLAKRTGKQFIEGDKYHSDQNVAKMSQGEPLTDEDREDWLDRVAAKVGSDETAKGSLISCSALKLEYRNKLRTADEELFFIHLQASEDVLSERLRKREGHFMGAHMLKSQLDTLEIPHEESKLFFYLP